MRSGETITEFIDRLRFMETGETQVIFWTYTAMCPSRNLLNAAISFSKKDFPPTSRICFEKLAGMPDPFQSNGWLKGAVGATRGGCEMNP